MSTATCREGYLIALLLLSSALVGLAALPPPVVALSPHAPIAIVSDANFTAANGVTGGSGTVADPYMIEGWDIDASSSIGIVIQDTTAAFVIRNLKVAAGATYRDGISLTNVTGGRIENVTAEALRTGLVLIASADTEVFRNNVSGNHVHGLLVQSCSRISIAGNDVAGSLTGDGVRIEATDNVTVGPNAIGGNSQYGVYVRSSENATVADNMLPANTWGVRVESSADVTVTRNVISFSANGIQVGFSSRSVVVEHNDLAANQNGILVSSASNVDIRFNNITASSNSGIQLITAPSVRVTGNYLSGNNEGITLEETRDAVLERNLVRSSTIFGVALYGARNITLLENAFVSDGIFVASGFTFAIDFYTSHTIGTDNTVNGLPVRYHANCAGLDLDGLPTGQLIMAACTGVRVSHLQVDDTGVGFELVLSTDVLVENNSFTRSTFGIFAGGNANLSAVGNRLDGNFRGVAFFDNTGASVHHNAFVNNTDHAADDMGSTNSWDDGYPSGGNYWSNYSGPDACSGPSQNVCPDPDGIGDVPFVLDADSQDRYPLMTPPVQGTNTPPTAALGVSSNTGSVTTLFVADASASTDAEDPVTVLEVRWDWEDDGSWDTGWSTAKVAYHTFGVPGAYTIRVEVRDSEGATDTATASVTVVNLPPTAELHVAPERGERGTVFAFDASASTDLEDGFVGLSFRWDWEGDGTWDTPWAAESTATRAYGASGTYEVWVEVRDTGALSDNATVTIHVAFPLGEPNTDATSFIIAGAVAVAVSVALAVTALVWRRKRRRRGEGDTS